jgi:hypothetical protein
MHTRKGAEQFNSTSNTNQNEYFGSTTTSAGIKSSSTRFSKFYNHAAHGLGAAPNSALSQNRVFQFISSESQGEKVIKQQEQVLRALDSAKIDLKKKGVLVD